MKYGCFLLSFALLGACSAGSGDAYTDQELAAARASIPTMGMLEAPVLQQGVSSLAAVKEEPGEQPEPAEFAEFGDSAVEINAMIGGFIQMIRTVSANPPSQYDAAKREFLWGPYPAEDIHGYVAVWVRDTQDEGDFRYEYAIAISGDDDIENLRPILWGAGTPHADNENWGVGVMLLDFDEVAAHHTAHNPSPDANMAAGRFAAAYARGPNDDTAAPNDEVGFVVAAFRDFVSEEEPNNAPIDADYLYGRVMDADNSVAFIDLEAIGNVDEDAGGTNENLRVRMAFVNDGLGRAEVDISGGSVSQPYSVVECWDAGHMRTHYAEASVDDSGCGLLFQNDLDALNVPELSDVDADLRAELGAVAENGV